MVRLDQRRHCVMFPATLNLDHGAMEYFLVSTFGKTHQSILRIEAEPYLWLVENASQPKKQSPE
jgi:hypothetical protein